MTDRKKKTNLSKGIYPAAILSTENPGLAIDMCLHDKKPLFIHMS
jgi:hypothetical protein